MDSLEYNGFTTDSDAFIELEDFDCFTELESSYAVYANRLSRSQYTYLDSVLAACDGDKERAADILGISTRSLYRKLQH